jgi:hypothetical protein
MKAFLSVMILVLVAPFAFSATGDSTDVYFQWTFNTAEFRDSSGAVLTRGNSSAFGDGAIVQLGYYDAATTAANFSGNWVALTGEGGANSTYVDVGIGDMTDSTTGALVGGASAGEISVHFIFTEGLAGSSVFPSLNTIPLAMRFYNGTTIAGSSSYNVVSSDSWLWKTPTAAGASLNPRNNGTQTLEWLDSANPFKTSISIGAIPEPSTYALLGMGLLGLLTYRRKQI